jgi:DNA modification methylase
MPGSLIQGNALHTPLQDKSVQLCCFSPPYWGLRKYKISDTEFPGGWKGQMGLEPNINRYLDNLMLAMAEVWRVLRNDGCVFVNIGDSYWNPAGSCNSRRCGKTSQRAGRKDVVGHPLHRGNKSDNPDMRPKSLCLIPQRFAIRCQEAGWIVRSEVIFHKLNPIPESCNDRPTKSHEQVWMLTKTGKYFWDKEAVKEKTKRIAKVGWKESDLKKYSCDPRLEKQGTYKDWRKYCPTGTVEKRNIRSVWTMATEPHPEAHFACVDEKTECLTLLGWKKYNKIKEGELIAVFDMQTEKAFWYPVQQILSYNRFKQDQNVVKVKTRNTDMVLTPHHNTIIKRRLGRLPGPLRLGQYSFVKAKDLKPSHYIPRAADWVGTFESPISQDFAELLGWYVTDGHENKNSTRVEIYQSKSANEEKVNRIKYLLDKCGAEYKEATYERTMSGFQKHKLTAFRIHGYIAYKLRELAPHKILSWATLNWTDSLLKRLLDGLIGGDGTRRGNRFQFIQKHKLLPDLVQAITFRLGYQSTLSVQKNEMRQLYVNTERKAKSLRGKNSGIKKIQMVEYEGVVWCPSTDVGTFVARLRFAVLLG